MARLEFEVSEQWWGGLTCKPFLDGVSLARLLRDTGGYGMWPEGLARVLLPPRGTQRRTQVLTCDCCDHHGALVDIVSQRREIVWHRFHVLQGRTVHHEVRFPRWQYVRALETLPREAWEHPERQPAFRDPGPPHPYLLAPEVEAFTYFPWVSETFEAVDQRDAEEQAAVLAARRGVSLADCRVNCVGYV